MPAHVMACPIPGCRETFSGDALHTVAEQYSWHLELHAAPVITPRFLSEPSVDDGLQVGARRLVAAGGDEPIPSCACEGAAGDAELSSELIPPTVPPLWLDEMLWEPEQHAVAAAALGRAALALHRFATSDYARGEYWQARNVALGHALSIVVTYAASYGRRALRK